MIKTKILVTGGAGFIGSALVEKLLEKKENEIVVVDNLLTGNIKKLPPASNRLRFIRCDVNNFNEISQIMMSFKFDYVFHYAAIVGVQRTLQHPIYVLNDINGIKNILELSKNTGVKRVFYSSSSEIYGEPVEYPQNEDTTPLNSRLPYAIVKNVGEAYLRAYHKEYGLNYTIFRFFNTYGPKQSKNFVISKFFHQALTNTDITIYGDGQQTRTFCYITDNIDVCISAFYNKKFINDVLNVGGNIPITMNELAEKIINITRSKSKIVYLPPLEEGDMRGRKPDIKKMISLISKPLIPLDEGLKMIYKTGLFENGF
ncbi:MAG: NAD-dependent epimerase/dehydratase family protein [Marinilabiliales bacterium]